MTEYDWCESCHALAMQNQRPRWEGDPLPRPEDVAALRSEMHVWADWLTDEGLDYAEGLRALADYRHGPRFPLGMGTWFHTRDWRYSNTIPIELESWVEKRARVKKYPAFIDHYADWPSRLDAVRDAAREFQRVMAGPWQSFL